MRVAETSYGEVVLRNIMLDLDGSNLEEAVEISFIDGSLDTINLLGWMDIEKMKIEEIEEFILLGNP